MLQVQPGPNLTPRSIGDLLDQYTKLSPSRLAQIFQTFIAKEQHIPIDARPYVFAIFFERGKQIVTMISCILAYTTDEFIDELILAFMSIFMPGKPPAILYNYAQFIVEGWMINLAECTMKEYSSTHLYFNTCFCIISKTDFLSPSRSWILKTNPGLLYFGHRYSTNIHHHKPTQTSLTLLSIWS